MSSALTPPASPTEPPIAPVAPVIVKPKPEWRRFWITPDMLPGLLFAGTSSLPGTGPTPGDIVNNASRWLVNSGILYEGLTQAINAVHLENYPSISGSPLLLSFVTGLLGFILTWLKQHQTGPVPVDPMHPAPTV